MRRPILPLLGLLLGLVLLGSCVDGSAPVSPRDARSLVRLPLAASLVPSPADAAARPINRIRATARVVPAGTVVGESVLDVDAEAAEWEIGIDLDLAGPLAQIVVELALIHVDAAGTETIEFSGEVGPIAVRPGDDLAPANVQVVRGPSDNLAVTGIEIVDGPPLVEGSTRGMDARVVTDDPGADPFLFWTSLDPEVLRLDGATAVGLLPGTGRVVASAGGAADTASVLVLPLPSAIEIAPDSVTVEGIGREVQFTAAVLDPRGVPISDQPVLWRSLAPGVVAPLSDGRFGSVGEGEATVEARAAVDTTLRATAAVRVRRPATDLAVSKAVSAATAASGEVVTFTLAVENRGEIAAAAVRVRDVLPTGLALDGAPTGSGAFDASSGIWTVGSLEPGGRATLVVPTLVTGAPGTRIVNTAEVLPSADQVDLDPSNDRATATVEVMDPLTDLSLTKTVSRAAIPEGDTATFTVTVANLGEVAATNVLVRDSLPPELEVMSEAPSVGAYTSANGWAIARLDPGESARLTLGIRAPAGTGGGTYTNRAWIAGVESPRDPNPANDVAAAALEVQFLGSNADVGLVMEGGPTGPNVGDTVTFSVTVTNHGPDTVPALDVLDSLDVGLVFVSATASRGEFLEQTMSWAVGILPPLEGGVLDVRAVVQSGTEGQTLGNTARLPANRALPDLVPGNDVAEVSVVVAAPRADIELSKAVDVATPGERAQVRFTVTATNLGPNDASGVTVADRLPAGLQLDSARTQTGTVSADTLWEIPSLPVSSSAVLHLWATVLDGTAGTTITNQARRTASTPADPAGGNDVAAASVNVARRVLDLAVRKTASDPRPVVGSPFVYTVTLVNEGPGEATGVEVADSIPAELTLDSLRTSVGAWSAGAWAVPTLAEGDSATLRAFVRVPAELSGQTVTNRAILVTAGQDDSDASNDTAAVTLIIPVSNPPVVTILAPNDGAVYDPGDTIVFLATASDQEDGPLTSALQWVSNVSGQLGGGGQISSSTLAPGPHLVAAQVTDSNGNTVADTVALTIAIVTTPVSLNVPFGGSASLPISLSAPAPAGGLTLTITSDVPGTVAPVASTVVIPAGALSANAQLSGLLPGNATVTASTAGYGSSQTAVSVTAALDIQQSSVSFSQGFSAAFTVRLESQNLAIAAPAGGLLVDLTAAVPGCVAVPAQVTIPAGQVQAAVTATWGGATPTPCSSVVTASTEVGSITSDVITVTANVAPFLTVYPTDVGSGLQVNASMNVSYSGHGGFTARLTSPDSSRLLLSPNATTPGTGTLDLAFAAGATNVQFHLQGVAPDTGQAQLLATAPGITGDTVNVRVAPAMYALSSVTTSTTTLTADDPIWVQVGISDLYYNGVNVQSVRAGGSPLTATVTVSDSTIAQLVTSGGTGRTAVAQIQPQNYRTPTTVATGGIAIDPLAEGAISVTASIPGLLARPLATANVSVSAPGITVYATTVGAGLQIPATSYLQTGTHGGTTVRIESTDTEQVLVSPNANTPGTAFIDVVMANGQTAASYYVQGAEGGGGTAYVRVSAPAFAADSALVTVVPPNMALVGAGTALNTFSPDDAFQVVVGVSDLYYGGVNQQAVRAGGQPLTATVTTSDSSRVRLVTSGGPTDTATVTIAVGQSASPSSVAAGGIASDPHAAGTATITGSIPGFVPRPNASVGVTVTAPSITAYDSGVGAGLQISAAAYLGAGQHGGVTVRLESTDPGVALVSPDASTPGVAALDVVLANGQTAINYHLQGIEAGSARIRVSAPGFTADSSFVTVSQPYVALVSVPSTTTTLSTNSAFRVAIGVSDLYYGGVNAQAVRAGGTPVTATVTSSVVGVGQIVSGGVAAASHTVQIPVGQAYTAVGALAFDPVGTGSTTVSASIPGFLQRPTANSVVTVSAPVATVYGGAVGAGLQFQSSFYLGATNHGGVTVTVRSSSSSLVRLAPNGITAGSDSVSVFVPAGSTTGYFWIQGVEGTTGTVSLTASAPGFTDGSATVDVQQPALALVNAPTSIAVGAADRLFYVYVGISDLYYGGVSPQQVSGGAAPVVATVTSSQPAVGTLVTTEAVGTPVTVQIPAGQFRSATSVAGGGIAFDPLSAGSTTISATVPGYVARPNATVGVTVTP